MSIHCPIEDLANSYHHLPSDLWAFPQPISLFDNQPKSTLVCCFVVSYGCARWHDSIVLEADMKIEG